MLALVGASLGAGVATADPADDLRAQGEALAKAGRYTEAIAAFKESNRDKARATNSCLIGLAYTRRELWPQAEIMIDRCKREASAADPTPDWLPALEQELAKRLATVGVAPVTIVVEPAAAKAELTVSSFAPDELFEPRTIHLPPGSHVVVASAPGYAKAQRTIEITADLQPRRVVIELRHEGETPPPPAANLHPEPPPPPPPPLPAAHSAVPLVVMGAGGAMLAAGIVFHATAFRTAATELADATDATPDPRQYDQWSHRYDVRREWLVGLYAAGAITAGIGLYLRLSEHETEALPQISVVPITGGGLVSVGWR